MCFSKFICFMNEFLDPNTYYDLSKKNNSKPLSPKLDLAAKSLFKFMIMKGNPACIDF